MHAPTLIASTTQNEEKLEWSVLDQDFFPVGLVSRCYGCNSQLGINSPHQYCRKTHCHNDTRITLDETNESVTVNYLNDDDTDQVLSQYEETEWSTLQKQHVIRGSISHCAKCKTELDNSNEKFCRKHSCVKKPIKKTIEKASQKKAPKRKYAPLNLKHVSKTTISNDANQKYKSMISGIISRCGSHPDSWFPNPPPLKKL